MTNIEDELFGKMSILGSSPDKKLENGRKKERHEKEVEFEAFLREKKIIADKILQLYERGKYHSDRLSKNEQGLLEEFKNIHTKRIALQREVLRQKFIEDERIGFGGSGEHILKIQPGEISSKINKYILKIAKVLQIADNFNK